MSNPESSFLRKPGAIVELMAIAVLWCIAVVLINPIGDFPLYDDWSMGLTVKRLLEQHDFRPSGWTCMTLISQSLWGLLFCLPHGFSFTALRLSTLTLSLIGVLSFYVLLRQLHRSRSLAVFCALLLAFNPVYFALSNTFMTDAPFAAMATLAALFFVHYFQTESISILVIATVLTIVATLCRQLGLALPLAFSATFLLKYGFQKRRLAVALTPSVLVIGCWVGYNHWLRTTGRVPAIYDLQTNELLHIFSRPWTIPVHLAHHGWNALMYLGCFLLPLLILVMPTRGQMRVMKLTQVAFVLFLIWTVARFIFIPGLMPVHGNILDPHGIGPFTLRDEQLLKLHHVPPLPKAFWIFVTGLSLIGSWLLISYCIGFVSGFFATSKAEPQSTPNPSGTGSGWWHAFSKWQIVFQNRLKSIDQTIAAFFLICALVYLGPLAICGFFDRYLIPAMIFLVAFFAATTNGSEIFTHRWPRIASAVPRRVFRCLRSIRQWGLPDLEPNALGRAC